MLSDVVAGCTEHPEIASELIFDSLQSGTSEPLSVFVPGLILVIVSVQNDGSI
jgi:hypothetical protein